MRLVSWLANTNCRLPGRAVASACRVQRSIAYRRTGRCVMSTSSRRWSRDYRTVGFGSALSCCAATARRGITRRFTACIDRWCCTYVVQLGNGCPSAFGYRSTCQCSPIRFGLQTLFQTHSCTASGFERSTWSMISTTRCCTSKSTLPSLQRDW